MPLVSGVQETEPFSYDNNHSGVSWSAVFAGAAAAAVLSVVLFILGFGLGLSALSPWGNSDGSTFGWTAIAWVAFTQIAASALGGYLAGRLRVKWTRLHGDEVYFRDTAHGFLAWAIASLLTVAVLSSATATIASGGAKAGAALTGAVAAGAAAAGDSGANTLSSTVDYYTDNLFRNEQAPTDPALDAADRDEVARIFVHSLAGNGLTAEDKTYLGQLIAQRTGLNGAEAEARIDQAYAALEKLKNSAKEAADKARKTTAYISLWMFVALLCGAFIASVSATLGGKQRDSFAPLA